MRHIHTIIPTYMGSGNPLIPLIEDVLLYTPWVYLHGELESKASSFGGWDKFKWFGDAPEEDGIYECRVWMGTDSTNTQILEATAFIWEAKFGEGRTKVTGLIVLNGDTPSADFAFKKYQDKADMF